MANELEKLPEFAMATGSDKEFYQRNDFWRPPHTQTIQAQVASNHPTQYQSQPYPYGHNIIPVDQEGDVQMGGINALQAQMQSLLAAFNSTQGKGDSKNKEYKIDNLPFPPDLSQPERNRRVEQVSVRDVADLLHTDGASAGTETSALILHQEALVGFATPSSTRPQLILTYLMNIRSVLIRERMTSERSRAQRQQVWDSFGVNLGTRPSKIEILQAKNRMDSKPFLIDTFINNNFYLSALFDSGCLPYAAFKPRQLKLAKDDDKSYKIYQITFVTLDISDRKERLWGYVIHGLHYDLILGKGWAERNNAVYQAGDHVLYIGRGHQKVKIYENTESSSCRAQDSTKYTREAKLVSAHIFSALTRRARSNKEDFTLASVTISDINKALEKLSETHVKPTVELIRGVLPRQLHGLEEVFLEDSSSDLPPHRPGHDMEINLEKDDKNIE
ncbi:hypothetical protein K3495_g11801 [Podosphaera aphanis]|nr:hypothetical protein K3495_g11801 [Podosphaera aphanis]